jgi:hypothetical protein
MQTIELRGPIDSARIVSVGPSSKDLFWYGCFFTLGAVWACAATFGVLSALAWLINLAKGW